MKIFVWDSMESRFIERMTETNPFVWSGYIVVMTTGGKIYLARQADMPAAVDCIDKLVKALG